MKRRNFLKKALFGGITLGMASLAVLNRLQKPSGPRARMPVLFLGHGSPMNAISENEFVEGCRACATRGCWW